MVSHELRTPLASIKAYVEMLIDGEAVDEKTTREFYDVIQNEANRLGRLIDNILNISRIESGLVKVDKRPQSLTAVVRRRWRSSPPRPPRRRSALTDDLPPVAYQTRWPTSDMLYQAVLNLLGNAVKYTPEGGEVTVRTTVDEAGRQGRAHGSSTPASASPARTCRSCSTSSTGPRPTTRMARGTGLGLALVRHIIESVHGGRMFVESQVGKGSCSGSSWSCVNSRIGHLVTRSFVSCHRRLYRLAAWQRREMSRQRTRTHIATRTSDQ